MAEVSIAQILESESYKHQKEVVNRAINKNVHPVKLDNTMYAPARLADIRRVMSVDYKVFEKTEKEKGMALTLKKQYLKAMRAMYPNWTKRSAGKAEFLTIHAKNIW